MRTLTAVERARKIGPKWANLLEVVDATESIRIYIGPEECDGATRQSLTDCPGSRGSKRECDGEDAAFGKRVVLVLNPKNLDIKHGKGDWAARFVPEERLLIAMAGYDNSGVFPQGVYVLRVPDKGHRIGAAHAVGRARTKRTNLKKGKQVREVRSVKIVPQRTRELAGVRPWIAAMG